MKIDGWKKIVETLTIKNVSYLTIILNLASILLGVVYLIMPISTILGNIFGVIILLSLFGNLLLAWVNSVKLNKTSKIGNRYNLICYLYLLYIIFAMIMIALGNIIVSIIIFNDPLRLLNASLLVYINYFAVLGCGVLISYYNIKNKGNEKLWNLEINFGYSASKKTFKIKRIVKKLLKFSAYLTFVYSILMALSVISGFFGLYLIAITPALSGQFGVFFSIGLLANMIILLKLKTKKRPRRYRAHAFIGVLVSGVLLVPLLMTPLSIMQAEVNFMNAFGEDWNKIDASDAEPYFLDHPFSLDQYFLGIPPKDCIVIKDISYYNGTTGVDEGIKLHFNAYLPPNNGIGLPGKNSTLIRIHGGGWLFGSPTMSLGPQINKYFAAQGYVVFDIQYGLYDLELTRLDPTTPKDVKGNFTIDDMVRHIGIFIKYLINHSEEFGANLNSVFISGGSAGGHLTMATGLGLWSNNYVDYFGTNLTIKGIIPFYPANGQMKWFGVSGTEELMNPELMINSTSPPSLIFQGTHDVLNMFHISENIRERYISSGNPRCAILWMPGGGHASDIYFNGYYTQVFLYYWERFMYLYTSFDI